MGNMNKSIPIQSYDNFKKLIISKMPKRFQSYLKKNLQWLTIEKIGHMSALFVMKILQLMMILKVIFLLYME